MKRVFFLPCSLVLLLAACGQAQTNAIFTDDGAPQSIARVHPQAYGAFAHVVIIVQENRSIDNLFYGFPGADTVTTGKQSTGKSIALAPVDLAAPYDIDHAHSAWETEYDNGKLDGFNLVQSHCRIIRDCPIKGKRAYAYVPHSESAPYFEMAQQYGLADHMFETNQGPSFPAHQYLLSGTSTVSGTSTLRASENPLTPRGAFTGGCNSPPGSTVEEIDVYGQENQSTYPCFSRISMMDLIDKKKALSWRYYGIRPQQGIWNAPDAILQVRKSPQYKLDDVTPPTQVLKDVAAGSLASVTWVTPTDKASDHPGVTDGTGPSWVTSVVNAIGESQFWDNTVIFVVWDDWGGWYDHVQPVIYNSYELGFRVPLIVISPYTKQGFISHHHHEFGSILKFVEQNFGLGSMHTTDSRSDNLSSFFDFKMAPRQFVKISAPLPASYFLKQPISNAIPDDDY